MQSECFYFRFLRYVIENFVIPRSLQSRLKISIWPCFFLNENQEIYIKLIEGRIEICSSNFLDICLIQPALYNQMTSFKHRLWNDNFTRWNFYSRFNFNVTRILLLHSINSSYAWILKMILELILLILFCSSLLF